MVMGMEPMEVMEVMMIIMSMMNITSTMNIITREVNMKEVIMMRMAIVALQFLTS
jgi:hypothetical protein